MGRPPGRPIRVTIRYRQNPPATVLRHPPEAGAITTDR